ncbi:MAG: serine/threonine protein kinase, partial [Gammaproteobacteria bacterium]
MNEHTPYENLDPNLILDAVESLGFICSGNLLALNSYENRVYQIGIEDEKPMIAKFYRPYRWTDKTILEEHQFALELMDYEIPVVAPWADEQKATLHPYKGYRFALFPQWGGRALDLDKVDQLEWIGRFIGRVHAVGACRSFRHRPVLNVKIYGHDAYAFLDQNNFIPNELKTQYKHTIDALLDIIAERMISVHNIRLHG